MPKLLTTVRDRNVGQKPTVLPPLDAFNDRQLHVIGLRVQKADELTLVGDIRVGVAHVPIYP